MTAHRNGPMIQSAGNAPAVSSVSLTVPYGPGDGRVMHMHYSIDLAGAKRRTPEEQQQSARESAQRLGCNIDGLEMLHVTDFQPSANAYRVDLQTRTLVETASPRRKGRNMPPDSTGAGM
jgi:hypothetical protein